MRADDRADSAVEPLPECPQRIVRIKERSSRDHRLRPERIERPHHRIVLKAGDQDPVSRRNERPDRHVERVGRVHRKNDLLRLRVKECSRADTAVIDRLCRSHRRLMPAASGACALFHRAEDRARDLRRLAERRRAAVKIDHTRTSSSIPLG